MSQITTHILDTSRGTPATGVALGLFQLVDQEWVELASGATDADGRVGGLVATAEPLPAGVYRMHFATADYFGARGLPIFYPYVDVVFTLDGSGDHYHIPLLLSPYGYSTYRGS